MPFQKIRGVERFETLGGTGTPINDGTTITSGTANTKGSYASLGTTTFAWTGFQLQGKMGGGVSEPARIDVAYNVGGGDIVVVEDLFCDIANDPRKYFPVAVPSGATVKIRTQFSGASRTSVLTVVGYASGFDMRKRGSKIRSLTDWTNTQPSNSVTQTGNTQTAWTTICASTPAAVSRIWAIPGANADLSRTASDLIIDIGVGGGGNEQVIGQTFAQQSSTRMFTYECEIPVSIPAGSRLAFRVACAAAAADSMVVSALGLA